MSLLSCTYAAFAALVVLSAVAALVRGRAGGLRGAVQFMLSAPAIHAAPLLMALLAILSVVESVIDGGSSRCAQAGLATTAIAIGLLLWLERRAVATARTLDRALQDGFGADYGLGIPSGGVVRRGRQGLSIRPWNVLPDTVERLADLRYGTTCERHVLDLYRRREAPRDRPVLLALHGGAWVMGHKRINSKALIGHMADAGWLVVAINYQLGPRARFPEPLVDVKRAIGWIRSEAAKYGGDPQFVLACGESAGGHLAAMAALTANRPEYQPGFEHVDTKLCGAIPIYARLDFTDRVGVSHGTRQREFLRKYVMPRALEEDPGAWDAASPVACVHPDMPPIFVLHGTHDTIIPIEEAEYFVRSARHTAKAPVVFASLAGAQHAYELANSRWTHPTADAILAFGERLFGDYRGTRDRTVCSVE